jgi:hypothetical protein
MIRTALRQASPRTSPFADNYLPMPHTEEAMECVSDQGTGKKSKNKHIPALSPTFSPRHFQ